MSSTTLTIKVLHGQEIRRLSFAKPPTVHALVQVVANLFNLQLNQIKPLVYRDDGSLFPVFALNSSEDDIVTIGTDLDLLEAIRVAEENKKTLRLYVNHIAAG